MRAQTKKSMYVLMQNLDVMIHVPYENRVGCLLGEGASGGVQMGEMEGKLYICTVHIYSVMSKPTAWASLGYR